MSGAHPAWSPDGTRVAFERDQEDDSIESHDDLFVANADGSGVRRLTSNLGTDNEPAWSPDGKWIVFTSERRARPAEVWVMTVDGRERRRLTHDARRDEDPAWSPDGKKIAFVSDGLLYVMDPRGRSRKLLIGDGGDANRSFSEPAWSPDGSKIAFESGGGIWVANADGSRARELLPPQPRSIRREDRLHYGEPDWSPDRRWIIFEATKQGNGWFAKSEIWLMRADGTGAGELVLRGGVAGAHRDPKWRPLLRAGAN